MPLFDAYLMVDWSAAATPRIGVDSIWWSLLARDGETFARRKTRNPPTRALARQDLATTLAALQQEGRRVLVGFDFPFAYPSGFAHALGAIGTPWQSTWSEIAAAIKDAPDNDNNRFVAASAFNRRVSGRGFPFWGRHASHRIPLLSAKKPRGYGTALAEHRLVESRVRGPQPGWKLYGIGSAGGQALTGIPVVHALRAQFPDSRIWPFETGFDSDRSAPIVFAEIYPSLFPLPRASHAIKDRAQVETTARAFAQADGDSVLAAWLRHPRDLMSRQHDVIAGEEGWILGVA
jgi:precorrin-8X/cobalt-precorrin-8 methylmutase